MAQICEAIKQAFASNCSSYWRSCVSH